MTLKYYLSRPPNTYQCDEICFTTLLMGSSNPIDLSASFSASIRHCTVLNYARDQQRYDFDNTTMC